MPQVYDCIKVIEIVIVLRDQWSSTILYIFYVYVSKGMWKLVHLRKNIKYLTSLILNTRVQDYDYYPPTPLIQISISIVLRILIFVENKTNGDTHFCQRATEP